jgi:hypothetical protein
MAAISQVKKASVNKRLAFQIFVLVKICPNFKRLIKPLTASNLNLSP